MEISEDFLVRLLNSALAVELFLTPSQGGRGGMPCRQALGYPDKYESLPHKKYSPIRGPRE